MSSKFRYDISFLRVIAVLAVVFYHYNIKFFKGGFIGVDIFFVISGFLMTKIILSGSKKENFNVIEFYKRRVIRIIPALLAMLIAFGFAIYFFIPTHFIEYLKSACSSSIFVSNISYYFNTGYFDQASHYNFLLHTWSLSVEWQFYLVYPLLLLPFRNASLSTLLIVFCIIISLSFGLMLWHNKTDRSFSFFMFYTRAWEMLFGGVAFLLEGALKKIPRLSKKLLVFANFSIICFLILTADSNNWPSYLTLAPVLTTSIILGLNIEFTVYRNRILKYLGDMSYTLYLYHWPIYVMSVFYSLHLKFQYRLGFIILSFLLASGAYNLVERRNYKSSVRPILILTIFFFCFSYVLMQVDANYFYRSIGNLVNIASRYKNSEEAKAQYNMGTKHLRDKDDFKYYNKANWLIPNNQNKTVVLLGDSHAGMFAKTIQKIICEKNYNFIQITADATYPMVNSAGVYSGPISLFNEAFEQYFPENCKKIDLVIINANYAAYPQSEIKKKLDYTNNFFKTLGVPVIYLGQTESHELDYPSYQYIKNTYGLAFPAEEARIKYIQDYNTYLKECLGANYIDLLNDKKIALSERFIPYIYDNNHLTYFGTEQHRQLIASSITSSIKIN